MYIHTNSTCIHIQVLYLLAIMHGRKTSSVNLEHLQISDIPEDLLYWPGVQVRVCVCMYVCMYVCMQRLQISVCVCVYGCMYVCMQHLQISVCVRACVCVCACVCDVCIYVYACEVCMFCICLYVCVRVAKIKCVSPLDLDHGTKQ